MYFPQKGYLYSPPTLNGCLRKTKFSSTLLLKLDIYLKENLNTILLLLLAAWHVGSSSLTEARAQVPCAGSVASQPLDHEEAPTNS